MKINLRKSTERRDEVKMHVKDALKTNSRMSLKELQRFIGAGKSYSLLTHARNFYLRHPEEIWK